jgi:hypothetical protein
MIRLSKSEVKLFGIWCVLAAITLASLESIHLKGWLPDARFQGAGVLILAFIKVRLIMLDFMEVRRAPIGLRIVIESWVIIACGGLIVLLFNTFQ